MSVIEEILRIKNKLSKMTNDHHTMCRDQALDLLRTLQKMPMTVELLLKTRIGLSVNTFRLKSRLDFEVACLAKQILRDWKKLIPEDITKNQFSSATTNKKGIENSADNIKKDSSSVITSDDQARLKCRDLLENSLILYASVLKDCTCPKKLATELENIIYQHHKNSINSCEKCLQRKERKERSKQMEADLREQEKRLSAFTLEPSQISENQHTQLQQRDSNAFNLLQSLRQMRVSSIIKQDDNTAQDIEFIP